MKMEAADLAEALLSFCPVCRRRAELCVYCSRLLASGYMVLRAKWPPASPLQLRQKYSYVPRVQV